MSSKREVLKRLVEDPLMLFDIFTVFLAIISGAIVIYVGLFFGGTADILPVWCYRVIFVVIGSGLFAAGIQFWMKDVGPYIKERLK